jgi:hypothetical protein
MKNVKQDDVWAAGNKVIVFNGLTPVITTGIVTRSSVGFCLHLGSGPMPFIVNEESATAVRSINGNLYTAKPFVPRPHAF